jgi:hypothetical protein
MHLLPSRLPHVAGHAHEDPCARRALSSGGQVARVLGADGAEEAAAGIDE